MKNYLAGQKFLLLGLGVSGLSMARWCLAAGASLRVADTREDPPGLAELRELAPEVEFIAGDFAPRLLEPGDDGRVITRVLRSPGLSPRVPAVAELMQGAAEKKVPVEGELGLFIEALAQSGDGDDGEQPYAPQVIAVTGTNGKTTVTSLTGKLVERAGKTVAVAGNIGPALLDTLSERLSAGELPQAWVLELSSFQLEGVEGFDPAAATILNITQDHLDWHGSMEAYAAAKARVFGPHTTMVLNRDDERVIAMRPVALPKPAGRPKTPPPFERTVVTFGTEAPQAPGDFGIALEGGMAWLVEAAAADETRADGGATFKRLMPADALRIRGRHNAANALAALALATSIGCPMAPMLYGLREYRGEPHRVAPVGRVSEVEYFDDSKGTNVGATAAALAGLGPDHRIIVILGGDGKGQDFSPLAPLVTKYCRAVLLIGRDAPLIERALADTEVPLAHAKTMSDAVMQAAAMAQSGDAVLMSPACASWDMYNGYAERAQAFVDAVRELAEDRGQMLGGEA